MCLQRSSLNQWMLLNLTPWVFSWFVVSIRREFTSMCWSAPGFSKRPLHAGWMSRLHNSTSHRSCVSSRITSLNCTSTSSCISHFTNLTKYHSDVQFSSLGSCCELKLFLVSCFFQGSLIQMFVTKHGTFYWHLVHCSDSARLGTAFS